MDVVHRRRAHVAVVAVDLTDEALDAFALVAIGRHVLATGHGDLHEHALGGADQTVLQELVVRPQPGFDAFGVVEAIDTEDDRPRCAHALAQQLRFLTTESRAAISSKFATSMEIGNAATRTGRPRTLSIGKLPCAASNRRRQHGEVLRGHWHLEADHVGPQQPLEDLVAPRQAHEQLLGRIRDVEEEPDAQIRAERPQERRDELEVVVVHPDGRAGAATDATRSANRLLMAWYERHHSRWNADGWIASW